MGFALQDVAIVSARTTERFHGRIRQVCSIDLYAVRFAPRVEVLPYKTVIDPQAERHHPPQVIVLDGFRATAVTKKLDESQVSGAQAT